MENKLYINKALEYISKAWNDDSINLDKVAGAAGFSNSYFDKMFAEHTGKTIMEYVRTYKLIRSANMLRTSEESVLDIRNYDHNKRYQFFHCVWFALLILS